MEGGCAAAGGALTFLVGDARIGCQGLGNWMVRGFEFVAFTSSEEASVAISGMDGKDVHGRMINFLPSFLSQPRMAAENPSTMKAVQYDSYGGGAAGLKHVEVPIPSPKKNEALLKLEAAAINPVDWKIQKGILRPFLPPRFPFTPVVESLLRLPTFLGVSVISDVAGEVVEVGSGVNSFKKGDKVVGLLSFPNGGGLAEFAVTTMAAMAIRLPEVSPSEAAGLPIAGLTALQSLKAIGIKFDTPNKSSNILITAASGGVGHYAVQLAKYAGLHVTATCGARNIELVKSLGADEVVDYETPEGAKLKSPSDKKYDGVIHCATNIPWSTFEPNLSSSGKVIDITPNFTTIAASILKRITFSKKKLIPLMLVPKSGEMEFLLNLVKEGKLKTVIDSVYPLSKAEEAWAKSISGHATGKIIIEI
ncbi:hypothetical protein ZIOFF_059429 [Zingiber officinale]|uniref:Enoyl reductase (ER) domain-containing protein n=1 Tax=Zingiber officinale TaxID=94328 RepID=A0A8J5KBD2_ZINOF|nr:hypothetical protein ZIOFF_059429 [Zingiber officinale]